MKIGQVEKWVNHERVAGYRMPLHNGRFVMLFEIEKEVAEYILELQKENEIMKKAIEEVKRFNGL